MATERLQRRIDRLLDQIEEAADQNDWENVLRLAKQVLYLDFENVDAKTFLGMSEEFTGGATEEVEVSNQVNIISTIHAHPTMAEAIHEAALATDGRTLHA